VSGFAYRIDDAGAHEIDIKDALAVRDAMVWVHLTSTAEHAQAWLTDEAKLPDYVVEPLTASESRPRCEAFDSGAFLNLRGRSTEPLDSSDMLASLRIWAVKGRVISVARKRLLAVDSVQREVTTGSIRDPGDLITAFATAITSDLDPVVADLGDDLDDCEQQLDSSQIMKLRLNVTRVRGEAISYRRFLNPQRAALERLVALPGDWLGSDDRAHLAAAADRAARMAEELEAIRERSSLMHEALTDLRAEQLDKRSLIISIAALVFLPLTFITGLYGMNVEGLWYAKEPWASDAILAVCAVISIVVTGYFMARHWLR
jgi:zinc transporter